MRLSSIQTFANKHENIELHEIELDKNLFHSISLFKPTFARGVFGGQVISQALNAATKTVSKHFQCNSLHSYFLLAGDPTIPILYRVEQLRDGKSYCTRRVTACQQGKIIFEATVSFHVPEKCLFDEQWTMPKAPKPETLKTNQDILKGWLEQSQSGPNPDKFIGDILKTKQEEIIPMDVRPCNPCLLLKDYLQPVKRKASQLVWIKPLGFIDDDPTFSQAVLAYCSDYNILTTALLPIGVSRLSRPHKLDFMVTIDHCIWYHSPFRADQYLLYEFESPRCYDNRAFCTGRVWTPDGTLVASCAQEGVLRTSIKPAASKI